MNIEPVGSRECLIIGTGKIPMAEVQQVVKEFNPLSGTLIWSYLWLGGTTTSDGEIQVPYPVLDQILKATQQVDTHVTYGIRVDGWEPYQWEADDIYLTEFEEDDLVILWLLTDAPTTDELHLVQMALAADRTVLVMNEGLWQVDRITSEGMFERIEDPNVAHILNKVMEEAKPDLTAAIADEVMPVPAHQPDDRNLPEPNYNGEQGEHPADRELVAPALQSWQTDEKLAELAENLPTPPPYSGVDYDTLPKDELKRLVVERGLKADKRSVDSMVDALTADDLSADADVLPFKQKADDDHPSNGVPEQIPLAEVQQRQLDEMASEPDELVLTPEADAAELAAYHDGDVTETEGEIQKDHLAAIAENLGKVDAGAEKIQRMAEDMISSTRGAVPAETVAYRDKTRERLGIIIGQLEMAAEHHSALALLNAQMADVMLAMMQEVNND